jgi:Zn-dependent protease
MPVRLHYTWLIVALIGVPVLATLTLPSFTPNVSGPVGLLLALLTLVLFLGVVVLHELAHRLVARLMHVRFPVMNLYPLGAIARLPDRYASPTTAYCIAAAGPLASIALAWVLRSLAAGAAIAP